MIYVLAMYLVMSIATFVMFARDKRIAMRSTARGPFAGRTPEATLHLLELFGGFPGALVAQRVFRHKTRKLSYSIILWLIAVLHGTAWLVWLFFHKVLDQYQS